MILNAEATSYSDNTVQPEETYTYSIVARDLAGNESTSTTVSIVVPPDLTNAVDCPAFEQPLLNRYTFDVVDPNDPLNSGMLVDATGFQNGSQAGTLVAPGVLGDAGVFNESSVVTLGDYSPELSDGVTISAWIYPYDLTSVEPRFLSKATGPQSAKHYLMAGAVSGSGLRFRVRANNATTTLASTTGYLAANEWSFVTFTYDLNEMRIYHDGTLIAQTPKTGAIEMSMAAAVAIGNQPPGAGNRAFNGLIDDLRIYDGALSPVSISELYSINSSGCINDISFPRALVAVVDQVDVELSWEPPLSVGAGLAFYEVLRDDVVVATGLNALSYLDTGLTPIQQYVYKVRAVDIYGAVSDLSAPVTITTGSVPDDLAPNEPADAAVTSVSSESVTIQWSAVTDNGLSGVKGYRMTFNGEELDEQDTLELTLNQLLPLTEYVFTVSAVDYSNNVSAPVTVTFLTLADTDAPTTPNNLSLELLSTTSVELSWDAAIDSGGAGLAGYIVRRDDVVLAETVSVTSYLDNSVIAGESYVYEVAATDNALPPNVSAAVSINVQIPLQDDSSPPPAPNGLTATTVLFDSVALEWSDVIDIGPAGLAGYTVLRDGIVIGNVTQPNFIDTTVSASTSYVYSVLAEDAAIPANVSEPAILDLLTPNEPDFQPPEVPTNLQTTSASASRVVLIWDKSTDNGPSGIDGYIVDKDGVNIGFVIDEPDVDATFTDSNVDVGQSYTYTVRAVDNAMNESASISISVSIQADAEAPDSPSRLAVYNLKPTSVSLWWKEADDNGGGSIARYDIQRDGTLIGSTIDTFFVDSTLTPGQFYTYQVIAVDDALPENESAEAQISAQTLQLRDSTQPPVPSNVVAAAVNEQEIEVNWTRLNDINNESLIAGYKIKRDGVELPVFIGESSFTDTDLDINNQYQYEVAAVDQAGNTSAYSAAVSAQPSVNPEPLTTPERFAPGIRIVGPAATTAQAGDIDGDGDPDLAIAEGGIFHNGPQLLTWFEAPEWGRHEFGLPIGPFTGDSRLVDIDGDNDLDYVVSADSHSDTERTDDGVIYWYENTQRSFDYWEQHVIAAKIPDAFHIGEMRSGDIDNDGKIDIAVRHLFEPNFILYFQNDPDEWVEVKIPTRFREGLQLADLDGDGNLDIIANGYFLFAPANPRSTAWDEVVYDSLFFDNPTVSPLHRLSHSTKASTADLNNDGRLDVIVSTAEGTPVYMAWYEGPVDPRNGEWVKHIIEEPMSGNHQVEMADIDLDGDLDIYGGFAFLASREVFWFENTTGDGLNWTHHTIDNVQGCYNCVAADYDQDGDIDLAGPTEYIGDVYLFENLTIDVPDAPISVAPSGQLVQVSQPIYEWQPIDSSPYFRIQVIDITNDNTVLYDERLSRGSLSCSSTSCSIDVGISLSDGLYQWRVRSETVRYPGEWAETYFNVNINPVTDDAAIDALWGTGAAAGNNTGLDNYVLHLIGQSNAQGRGRGPNGYVNAINMLNIDGVSLPDYTPWSSVLHGPDAVLATDWPGSRQVVVVETAVGGISIQEWLDDEWSKHLAKIDSLPVPPDVKHVVLWVQGEADTHDAIEAGQNYIDSSNDLWDLLTTRLGSVRIADVLLNPNEYRGGPPDIRAGFAQVVNIRKQTVADQRDNVVTIGGNYPIGNDNAHYTQFGLELMAEDFLDAIADF